jgi:hypothetical protein
MKRGKVEQFLGRVRLYFQTGHNLILIIPWLVTQTTIWFYLLIENIPLIQTLFPNYYIFLVLFGIIYGLFTILFGFWYVRRSELFPSESLVRVRQNPYYRDIAKAIILLSEDKKEEVKEILNKWTIR